MEFPIKIKEILGEKCGNKDKIGLSGANIYIFDNMVLKAQDISDYADTEMKMLRWLSGRIPVPEVIAYEKTNKLAYLLMSRCAGKMACDKSMLAQPKKLCTLLAQALQALWETDIRECPSDRRLKNKLAEAEYNVINGLVDTENSQPDTYSEHGFKDPEALLYWLQNNTPDEEPVLTHGDFCLPNIIFKENTLSGFVDLGRAGTADKWCDIALCYRSLHDNFEGKYDGIKKYGFETSYLFDALGMKPDWDKIRYYILLDELF